MATEIVTTEVTDELVSQEMLAGMACEVSDDLGTASLNYVGTIGGQFSVDGNAVTGNKLICIVLDYTRTNVLYLSKYDPNRTEYAPPDCYAIAKRAEDLAPSDNVTDKKGVKCSTCKYNQRGSASLIKSDSSKDARACSNKMRLALLIIGHVDKKGEVIIDVEDITTAEIVFLSVPLLSTFEFQNYAKKLASVKSKPPCAVCTEITTDSSKGKGFLMKFSEVTQAKDSSGSLQKINVASPALLQVILARKSEAEKLLLTPYPSVTKVTEYVTEDGEIIEETKDF